MKNSLIDIDQFKKTFYRSYLPFELIDEFLQSFEIKEVETATQYLISIFNIRLTDKVLNKLNTTSEKQKFLRLCQDDFNSPEIIDFINSKMTNLKEMVHEIVVLTINSID